MATIEVVCALLKRQDLYLFALRPQGKHLADHWEFPGGKVEEGESQEQALAREIKEELGIEIKSPRFLTSVEHSDSKISINLSAYLCEDFFGEPENREHKSLRWTDLKSAQDLHLGPADRKILNYISSL